MEERKFKERYINPHTDFGFKYLFGTELNKDLLISFLNTLLQGEQTVKDVSYQNSEHLGISQDSRRAIFDVYCTNERGEKFIVEMQNVYQQFFKDRSVYYSTFPIREQAERGDWNYRLTAVYTIGILNFVFHEDRHSPDCFHHKVMLMDVDRHEVFFDKVTFIYLELPKFNKTENELVTMFDKWMYVLKNLSRLMERPAALQERVFEHIFQTAEIARFTSDELMEYEQSMTAYRDIVNAVDTAREEGLVEGILKGKQEVTCNFKQLGISVEDIQKATGLSLDEIEAL